MDVPHHSLQRELIKTSITCPSNKISQLFTSCIVIIIYFFPQSSSPGQHRRFALEQLFVSYVFALEMSGKYLKVTISHTQKSVKFRSIFIFLQEYQLIVGF